jgi:hypothetical protein
MHYSIEKWIIWCTSNSENYLCVSCDSSNKQRQIPWTILIINSLHGYEVFFFKNKLHFLYNSDELQSSNCQTPSYSLFLNNFFFPKTKKKSSNTVIGQDKN